VAWESFNDMYRVRTTDNHWITVRESAWNTSSSPFVESQAYHALAPTSGSWTVPSVYPRLQEVISDEEGIDSRFRNVSHTMETNEFCAPEAKCLFPRACSSNAYVWALNGSEVDDALAQRSVPAIDMDAYAEQALAYMLPAVYEGSSLINYLYELKDLKRSAAHALKYLRAEKWRKFQTSRRRLRDLKSASNRRALAKELGVKGSNAALSTTFGWVPLVGDAVKMYDELLNLKFKLAALKRHAGESLVRHYKRMIPDIDTGEQPHTDWVETFTGPYFHSYAQTLHDGASGDRSPWNCLLRSRWIQRPVYHATVRYSYSLPDVDDQQALVDARLDTLGVRMDPSIVWNALPYTFLLDWVVDVGGFLQSFARDNYPISVKVKEFCHSYKWHSEYQVVAQPFMGFYWGNTNYPQDYLTDGDTYPNLIVCSGMRKSYTRVRASPDIHSVMTRRPSLKQAALGGALLMQRTRWSKWVRLPRR
jgi:hypothetical protein